MGSNFTGTSKDQSSQPIMGRRKADQSDSQRTKGTSPKTSWKESGSTKSSKRHQMEMGAGGGS